MKIGITFSAGGHYLEAMQACGSLLEAGEHRYFFVTYKQANQFPAATPVYFVAHPRHGWAVRRAWQLLRNAWQSLRVYARERPDLIISTGADVTLPTMLISKILGSKLVFIESGANVTQPSRTGRLAYRFADLFIIQWQELQTFYPRAVYGGPLL